MLKNNLLLGPNVHLTPELILNTPTLNNHLFSGLIFYESFRFFSVLVRSTNLILFHDLVIKRYEMIHLNLNRQKTRILSSVLESLSHVKSRRYPENQIRIKSTFASWHMQHTTGLSWMTKQNPVGSYSCDTWLKQASNPSCCTFDFFAVWLKCGRHEVEEEQQAALHRPKSPTYTIRIRTDIKSTRAETVCSVLVLMYQSG